MVDGYYIMVHGYSIMVAGRSLMVEVAHDRLDSSTKNLKENVFYCLMLHRDNVTIVREIDRLFNVSAVLSGWESVAASQQDALSWRALAKYLSVLATRSLMHGALQVSFTRTVSISEFHFLFLPGHDPNRLRNWV